MPREKLERKIISYWFDLEEEVSYVVCNDQSVWWLDASDMWNRIKLPPVPQD